MSILIFFSINVLCFGQNFQRFHKIYLNSFRQKIFAHQLRRSYKRFFIREIYFIGNLTQTGTCPVDNDAFRQFRAKCWPLMRTLKKCIERKDDNRTQNTMIKGQLQSVFLSVSQCNGIDYTMQHCYFSLLFEYSQGLVRTICLLIFYKVVKN